MMMTLNTQGVCNPDAKTTQKAELGAKVMLELKEIKLLEKREELIRKRNERMNNFSSVSRKKLDLSTVSTSTLR